MSTPWQFWVAWALVVLAGFTGAIGENAAVPWSAAAFWMAYAAYMLVARLLSGPRRGGS